MCQRVSYKKKKEFFLASLKSLKIGVGAGTISQSSKVRIRIRTKMSRIPNTDAQVGALLKRVRYGGAEYSGTVLQVRRSK